MSSKYVCVRTRAVLIKGTEISAVVPTSKKTLSTPNLTADVLDARRHRVYSILIIIIRFLFAVIHFAARLLSDSIYFSGIFNSLGSGLLFIDLIFSDLIDFLRIILIF